MSFAKKQKTKLFERYGKLEWKMEKNGKLIESYYNVFKD